MLDIVKLERQHCDELAIILSTDCKLHKFLSQNKKLIEITGDEYYKGCLEWEIKKKGECFCILLSGNPIGSISYVHRNIETASVGLWTSSDYWNNGVGSYIIKKFIILMKKKGYSYLKVTIQKYNIRSKKLFERCGAKFTEDKSRWYGEIQFS